MVQGNVCSISTGKRRRDKSGRELRNVWPAFAVVPAIHCPRTQWESFQRRLLLGYQLTKLCLPTTCVLHTLQFRAQTDTYRYETADITCGGRRKSRNMQRQMYQLQQLVYMHCTVGYMAEDRSINDLFKTVLRSDLAHSISYHHGRSNQGFKLIYVECKYSYVNTSSFFLFLHLSTFFFLFYLSNLSIFIFSYLFYKYI